MVPELHETDRAAWHCASLPGTEDELWSQIKSGARQNIRKARKAGVQIVIGSERSDLLAFRALHVGLRKRKYRMLAQPDRFFLAVDAHFGPTNDYRVVQAKIDGVCVAGIVLLQHGGRVYYKFNASSEAGIRNRANDLVMWAAMCEAQRSGATSFDFGVSDLDQPGLIRYKRKYATEEGEVTTFRGISTPISKTARLVSASLPRLTQIFTADRCPDALTAAAGNALYRNFC